MSRHSRSLRRETHVERPLSEVFEFFSQAANLTLLTPPWLSFEILSPTPIEMRVGTLIDYRIRLRGIPLRWRSEITAWDPPFRFVDEQRRGPYRTWIHEHLFEPTDDGTLVIDNVEYSVLGGRWVDRFFVAPDLTRILDYRQAQIPRLLNAAPAAPEPA